MLVSLSTDHAFRRRCPEQLQAGRQEVTERLRAIVVAEAGAPVMLTYIVQVNAPIDDRLFRKP